MIYTDLVKGEPFELKFRVKSDPDTAKPITGYEAFIELRDKQHGGELIDSWDDSSPELTRIDGEGEVKLTLTPEQTREVEHAGGYVDLLLVDSAQDDGIRSDTVRVKVTGGITK